MIRLFPQFEEAFLEDVFGGGVIIDSAHDGALDETAIPLHQSFQGGSIALLDSGHEFFVGWELGVELMADR